MKLAALFLALLSSAVLAEQKPIAEYTWQSLLDSGKLKTGTIVTLPDKTTALKIENPGPQPLMVTLLTIEQPKITTDFYALAGEVRYEGVEGDGFLELWNHFGEAAYFSRGLAESGPMGKLRGSSDWRDFVLPFNATGAKTHPTKLVFNLQLPAKGVVYLRSPIKLTESSLPPTAYAQPGAWWSDRAGGRVGGVLGGVIGTLGGLAGWLGARGKARAFVLVTVKALIGLGVIATAAGLLALTSRQPYAVWYPLLLAGVICVVCLPFTLRRLLQRYRELELRRMTSMDAA